MRKCVPLYSYFDDLGMALSLGTLFEVPCHDSINRKNNKMYLSRTRKAMEGDGRRWKARDRRPVIRSQIVARTELDSRGNSMYSIY